MIINIMSEKKLFKKGSTIQLWKKSRRTGTINVEDKTVTFKVKVKVKIIFNDNNFKYYILSDGSIDIMEYLGNKNEVIIPGKIDGKFVKKIDDKAFYKKY